MAGQIQGEAPLFLVSKKNLNPSYWHLWGIKTHKKWNKLIKLWPPKLEGVKNFKTQSTEYYKGQFPNTLKILVCCFILIRVQK
jgi:hypothetical protein